ncbi:MAG: hypothetical protein EOO68_25220 [Moraxellaceae bacterium]|nr:MAG: hypothetical protein EOO68_25220 [Moraxellaceae bacterium]
MPWVPQRREQRRMAFELNIAIIQAIYTLVTEVFCILKLLMPVGSGWYSEFVEALPKAIFRSFTRMGSFITL